MLSNRSRSSPGEVSWVAARLRDIGKQCLQNYLCFLNVEVRVGLRATQYCMMLRYKAFCLGVEAALLVCSGICCSIRISILFSRSTFQFFVSYDWFLLLLSRDVISTRYFKKMYVVENVLSVMVAEPSVHPTAPAAGTTLRTAAFRNKTKWP